MPEVNFNKKVSSDIALQTNLDTQQNTQEQKKELLPLLSRTPNLTVSNAPMDLEALLGKLNLEAADAKETSAKNTLHSVFTAVIAKAMERGTVSVHNLELLGQAEDYSKQLDSTNATIDTLTAKISQLKSSVTTNEKEATQIQAQVDSLAADITKLQAQIQQSNAQITILQLEIDSLTAQIEAEVDAQKQTNLKKRLADEQKKIETERDDLNKLQAQKEATQTELNKAQAKLDTVKANLAAANGTLSDAEAMLAAAKTASVGLKQKIQQALSEITDVSVLRDIADALKMDVSSLASLTAAAKTEHSEEEEKYLETHNPVQILQDVLSERDQEILDTITEKREEKV